MTEKELAELKDALTPDQAAKELGITVNNLYQLLHRGKITSIRVGSDCKGRIFITKSEVERCKNRPKRTRSKTPR